MMKKIKSLSKKLKSELTVYRAVLKDKRTPFIAKILLGLAAGYLLFPFDLVPDYIPILGQIDDVIVVPLLIYFALKLIPSKLIEEHRRVLYGYS